MMRRLLAKVLFKSAPSIQFEFEFHPVRIQSDMPDFKAVMLLDKFGKCSTRSSVLELDDADLQSWNLTKSIDGLPKLNFQIAGRTFDVSQTDLPKVFDYLMNMLPHLWKRDLQ